MKLFRNKEVKRMLSLMLAVTFAATAGAYVFSFPAAVISFSACLLLGAIFLWFTQRRYRQLARLSDYLKRVNGGDYALALPDNDEGELSILKNEIYKVTISLKEQNQRLNQEKLLLTDALSDISHQFKTPLTSMSVMAELLTDSRLSDEKRAEFTAQLRFQLERLTWLTGALLKLSRLDAEAVSMQPRRIGLQELLNKACGSFLIPMELKAQTLSVQAEGTVFCDLNWTAEALSNILKNCMEHTPSGGEISILARENALFTEIKVKDTGPGIDKADLPYLFDRFYKGKTAAAESVGIGLALSQSILAAQGGSLEAKNAQDGGTEFILRFPINKTE